MHKRVLLAEQSDAIRGVAETALRQNGFEVISVATAEKALEVLKFTRPDLIIVGGELTTTDQRPLYEKIRSHPKGGAIAMLLFDDSGDSLPFPPEAVIGRPFDSQEFLEKVRVFSGMSGLGEKQAALNPLEQANLDDDFLNAALGIDQIDVTDSEVMNKTGGIKIKTEPKSTDKFVGFDHVEKERGESPESKKVESVIIRDNEASDIRHPEQEEKRPPSPSATGKLEILSDQYGLTDPNALRAEREGQAHDYEWFIDEMRKETVDPLASPPPPEDSRPDDMPTPELTVSEPALSVDPITSPPGVSAPAGAPSQGTSDGIDKFLDEFKKEVEKIQADVPESVNLEPEQPSPSSSGGSERVWQESAEDIAPEEVNLFTHQLRTELAEKIAEKIIAKIDSEELLKLLKNEILSRTRNKPKQ
jgi:CheY-like chemotaxis protein